MGLETTRLDVSISPYGETVTVVAAYGDASIFNCVIDFVFVDGSLVAVRGRYVAGIEPAGDGHELSGVGTALLGFLAAVRNVEREDVFCTRVVGVEAGFLHRVVGSFGEGVLEPVWLISTDSGRYVFVDATGEVRLFGA